MRQFTKEDLAWYDGRDGVAAYIAYNQRVYDVSDKRKEAVNENHRSRERGAGFCP